MREIKFRGKSKLPAEDMKMLGIEHDNGWVYGYYVAGYIVGPVVESTEEYIALEWWCPVHRETVGQYTGLKDKNGWEIYEGDIVEMVGEYRLSYLQEVKYSDGYYVPLVKVEYGYNAIDIYDPSRFTVIGNIYENPGLLEEVR